MSYSVAVDSFNWSEAAQTSECGRQHEDDHDRAMALRDDASFDFRKFGPYLACTCRKNCPTSSQNSSGASMAAK